MAKININGIVREMTAEELAELTADIPPMALTADERLEELELALVELAEIIGGMSNG